MTRSLINALIIAVVFTGCAIAQPVDMRDMNLRRLDGLSYSSYLRLPFIREEVELVEDQASKIDEILDKLAKETETNMHRRGDGLPPPAGSETWEEYWGDLVKKTDEKVFKILLPFQAQKLIAAAAKQQMRSRGVITLMLSREVSQTIKLTPEQRQEIIGKANETLVELEATMLKAKKKALAELTSGLSKKQRDDLGKLFPLNEVTMPLFRFEKSSLYPKPGSVISPRPVANP